MARIAMISKKCFSYLKIRNIVVVKFVKDYEFDGE